ncbi:Serine/threonine-protein kinase B [compost metagenome]
MDHPFIPSLHDYFGENRSWWLVTDYVEGSTIEDLIFHDGHVFSHREVVEWTLQLMDPVQHVHSKGFVHLDLRIPNIIIKEGDLYLIDFGLAQSLTDTPLAIDSKEKADNRNSKLLKPANIQSDLFDIGHFMLFMLYSGYTPEDDSKETTWSQELKLPESLRQVLYKLLEEQEPYRCSTDLINDLNSILADSDSLHSS